jgi:DnaJ like chaperone protein
MKHGLLSRILGGLRSLQMASFIGKIIGGALGLVAGGGPLGVLLGVMVGHAYDERRDSPLENRWEYFKKQSAPIIDEPTRTALYNTNVVVLSAKLAKVDGRVTREEIAAFKKAFGIKPDQEAPVGNLFDSAHRRSDNFEPYAFQLAQAFVMQPSVLEQVLGHLFAIAVADDKNLASSEVRYLRQVAYLFNIGPDHFRRIAVASGAVFQDTEAARDPGYDKTDEPLKVLGVKDTATADEIKTAYRDLIRKHHPDKLSAEGKSPALVAAANEKMKNINAAYDTICKARGIK